MKIHILLAVLACLLSFCHMANGQDCHIALRGYVTEEQTMPLAYANVVIKELNLSTQTDEKGNYTFLNLCEGTTYTIEVSHIGCNHLVKLVQLKENTLVNFDLIHNTTLPQLLVVEKATEQILSQNALQTDKYDLENSKSVNLAETVRKLPGVGILNTGATIAKPIIQGLHSNRIAIVQNGTNLEAQQWGSEHAPEIDPFSADKITVVKGAAGVRYGIGAIAGALILEPAPLLKKKGKEAWLSSVMSSNGRGGLISGAYNQCFSNSMYAIRLQGTVKKQGNLHTPDYYLENSGLSEMNFFSLFERNSNRWKQQINASVFTQKIGILRAAHIGNLTDLQLAIQSDIPLNNEDKFSYKLGRPYQSILHNLLKYKAVYLLEDKWKLIMSHAFQFNKRLEYDAEPPLSDPKDLLKKPQISFRIWSNTSEVQLDHLPIKHWQGNMGVQGFQQLNFVGKGGLIPEFLTLGAAAWVYEHWRRFPSPWEYELGLRYDYRWSHVTDTLDSSRNLNVKLNYGNISANGGIIYRFKEHLLLKANSGFAWRPPHVNELYAKGVHHGAATFEQGNESLKTEKAFNNNLTLEQNDCKLQYNFSLFYNFIQDYIYLRPEQTPVLTIRGAFPAYTYQQTDAFFKGIDGLIRYEFLSKFQIDGSFSVLRANQNTANTTKKDWLPLINADKIAVGLKWQIKPSKDKTNTYLRLNTRHTFRQIRFPIIGLTKNAPSAFTLFDVDFGHLFFIGKNKAEAGLIIQNLTNQKYREYLDFFRFYTNQVGRNLSIRLKINF
jgi:iron complex outermembrane recepter protein